MNNGVLRSMRGFGKVFPEWRTHNLANFQMRTQDKKGVLKQLADTNLYFTHISSKLGHQNNKPLVQLDFTVKSPFDPQVFKGLDCRPKTPVKVKWFPKNLQQLSEIGLTVVKVNEDVNKDSPQFTDQQYLKRRKYIADLAINFRYGDKLPSVQYTQQENKTFLYIYEKLRDLHRQGMCERAVKHLDQLHKVLKLDKGVPQLADIDQYLYSKTKFRIKPTHGIVSQRQFFNAFAFRYFCCTQFLRHHSIPQYTPEPDIVHQVIGHVPTFADPEIADFSQEIGLLSLGATDEQISQLGTLYWFTIQFGAIKQKGEYKAYGAGIGSSIGQIKNFIEKKSRFVDLKVKEHCVQPYTIQDIQGEYKCIESFPKMMQELRDFGESFKKGVRMVWNEDKKEIEVDRSIIAESITIE